MKENKNIKIFECENGDLVQIGIKDDKIIVIRQSFVLYGGELKRGIYYPKEDCDCIYMIFEREYIKKFLELGNILINDQENECHFSGEDDYSNEHKICGYFKIYQNESNIFNQLPIEVNFFDSLEWELSEDICFSLKEFKIVLNCLENIIKTVE